MLRASAALSDTRDQEKQQLKSSVKSTLASQTGKQAPNHGCQSIKIDPLACRALPSAPGGPQSSAETFSALAAALQ